ncbi:hypothetical protein T02_4249, partial [Trichinella nativa]
MQIFMRGLAVCLLWCYSSLTIVKILFTQCTEKKLQFKEWNKEKVKSRKARCRTREEKSKPNNTSKGEVILKYFRIRGRHEAEQEKTKFLDPNSVSLGLGYFER